MEFVDNEHELFFVNKLKALFKYNKGDVYYYSLIYTLGICPSTRKHFEEIFDIQKGEINIDAINTNWLLNKPVSKYKYRNVFLIQMYMGLRVGEELALDTHSIDLHNKKLNVHRTLTTDEKGNIIMGNKTKTYAGKRILPIPDFLIPYFIEQMKIANEQ